MGCRCGFKCADLETCSIQNLGDVSSIPPEPGQVLKWDGTQYVPLPDLQFDCGNLSSCSLENLGNVSDTPPADGQTLVYSAASGGYVPTTECRSQYWAESTTALLYDGTQPISNFAPAAGTGAVPGTVVQQFCNPSPCAAMRVSVEGQITHANVSKPLGATTDLQVNAIFDITGDAGTATLQVHQAWRASGDTVGQMVWDVSSERDTVLTLPPGGCITVTGRMEIQRNGADDDGTATLFRPELGIHIFGGTV